MTPTVGIKSTFMNDTKFQLEIEEMVKEGFSYLEAIVEFCEDHDMEFEDVKKLMTTNLKDKVKLDAMEAGLMRQESMLPL